MSIQIIAETCPAPECNLSPKDVEQSVQEFEAYHERFVPAFRRPEQAWCSEVYLRRLRGATLRRTVERVSLDPGVSVRDLQHFIGQSQWDQEPIAAIHQRLVGETLGEAGGAGLIRIFDALNDWRNLRIAQLAIKAYGGRAEAALSYTVSPIHITDYFVSLALKLEDEGADQIAIKDMAGLLRPASAVELFGRPKTEVRIPVTFRSHTTTGVATLNAVIGMVEGIDCIDPATTPFAGGTSHLPITAAPHAQAAGRRVPETEGRSTRVSRSPAPSSRAAPSGTDRRRRNVGVSILLAIPQQDCARSGIQRPSTPIITCKMWHRPYQSP